MRSEVHVTPLSEMPTLHPHSLGFPLLIYHGKSPRHFSYEMALTPRAPSEVRILFI